MAFVQDDNEDKQRRQQAADPNAPGGGNGTVLSAPSAAMIPATGGTGTQPAGAAPASNQSGTYTNLQSYLGANQGEGQRMAGAVANAVASDATKADKAAGDWHDAAAKQINDAKVQDTAGLTTTFSSGDNKTLSGVKNADFQGLWNAQYQAPTLLDSSDANAAYDRVQQEGRLAGGDTASRGTLLRNTLVQPGQQYTKGENLLDSWLTGASPDKNTPTDNAFATAANTYGNYNNKLDALGKDLNTQQAAARTSSDGTRQAFQNAVNARQTALQGVVDPAVAKAAAANNHVHDLTTRASGADMTAKLAALKELGYNDDALNGVKFGLIDPKALLGQTHDYAAGDYMNADDRGAYTHLNDLLTGVGRKVGDNGAVATSGLDPANLGGHSGYNPDINAYARANVGRELIERGITGMAGSPGQYNFDGVSLDGVKALGINPNNFMKYDPLAPNGYRLDTNGLFTTIHKVVANNTAVAPDVDNGGSGTPGVDAYYGVPQLDGPTLADEYAKNKAIEDAAMAAASLGANGKSPARHTPSANGDKVVAGRSPFAPVHGPAASDDTTKNLRKFLGLR